ncbi:hypothetical protein KI387_017087, partial [Taxus chinensis]
NFKPLLHFGGGERSPVFRQLTRIPAGRQLMEQLVNFVIRPPRADYSPTHDLLEQEFSLKGCRFWRKDLEVINDHGNVLQCSHYMPDPMPEGRALPCVIYCHGNRTCYQNHPPGYFSDFGVVIRENSKFGQ